MARNRHIAILVILVVSTPAWGEDWRQFRGPMGRGVSAETGLPVEWSKDSNLYWKAELPGRGLSCPVIADGRVYVTASSRHKESRLHVLCFDAESGKKHWERRLWATGGTNCHPKTCMAAPTPITDGQRVYALFATGDIACLDINGNLLWYRSLVGDYPTITNQVGMAASPILYEDILIVPMENVGESFLAGIDKFTGQNRWKIERTRDINWVTPCLHDNDGRVELVFQNGAEAVAYDPKNGEKLWGYTGAGISTIPSPTSDGLLFIPGAEFVALRTSKDGLSKPEVIWTSNRLRSAYASPASHRGQIYTINSANALVQVAADTGEIQWRQRMKGPFSASPIIADGKAYCVNEEGLVSVVQLGDKPKVLAENAMGEKILATPSIANGAIFLRSDGHLYCIR